MGEMRERTIEKGKERHVLLSHCVNTINVMTLNVTGQDEKQNTVWYGMQEPKLDTEEIEK